MNSISRGKSNQSIKLMTRCGVLIALSAIGAMIKIQGTIAFDSMPGYFAALYINPIAGGVVAALGHFLTALTSGFPLSLPMHLMLMMIMGVVAYIFGFIGNKINGVIACLIATILNGPVCTAISAVTAKALALPFSGAAMFTALVVPLTIASAVNIVLAFVVHKIIRNKRI